MGRCTGDIGGDIGEKEAEHAQAVHAHSCVCTYPRTHLPTNSLTRLLTPTLPHLPTQLISALRKEHEAALLRDARARARSSFEPAELQAAGAAPSVPSS